MFLLRLKRSSGVGAYVPLCAELRLSNGAPAPRPTPECRFRLKTTGRGKVKTRVEGWRVRGGGSPRRPPPPPPRFGTALRISYEIPYGDFGFDARASRRRLSAIEVKHQVGAGVV